MNKFVALLISAVVATSVSAQLVDTRTDVDASGATVNGTLDAGEYGAGNAYSYAGGGGGFGGPLGSGVIYMNSDLSNLYIGFDPGANLNDNLVMLLDTVAGGQIDDSAMNDTGDPGRNLSSNLTRDVLDTFPVAMDYSVVIGQFGIVVFQLVPGTNLNFVQYDGTFTGNDPNLVREIAIPLASLGLTGGVASQVNFFAGYGSDTNYMSDEAVPAQSFSGIANLGFDNNGSGLPVNWTNYDQFITVPEPTTLGLLLMGALAMLYRRR